MKKNHYIIGILLLACVTILFRIFVWENFWGWLLYQSNKPDVLRVADLVSKFAPPIGAIVICLIASYIAWRQSTTAREKLRLELFEKRHKVADQVGRFFKDYHRTSIITNILTRDLSNAFYEGEFLFGDDFKEAMSALVCEANKLETLRAACLTSPPNSSVHSEKAELDKKFQDYWPAEMWKLFAKYLRFHNVA
ncbi:MAG: hypothetical protein ACK46A_15290 [Akkermansiaceae bacterium]